MGAIAIGAFDAALASALGARGGSGAGAHRVDLASVAASRDGGGSAAALKVRAGAASGGGVVTCRAVQELASMRDNEQVLLSQLAALDGKLADNKVRVARSVSLKFTPMRRRRRRIASAFSSFCTTCAPTSPTCARRSTRWRLWRAATSRRFAPHWTRRCSHSLKCVCVALLLVMSVVR
jgi:hypothetical protein